MRIRLAIAIGWVLASAGAAGGSTSLVDLVHSPDVTVPLPGGPVRPGQVADDDLGGTVAPRSFPGVPDAANLAAYQILENGDELLVFDVTVSFPGGVRPGPRDVVRLSAGGYTLFFDGAAAGVPDGTRIDAVALDDDGALLVSFDGTVNLAGTLADDEDLLRIAGSGRSLRFDGGEAGVPLEADLDAAHRLPNGHLLLSFDVSGVVRGVAFDDEDVLEHAPETGAFALAYDGSAVHPAWAAADLDALDGRSNDADSDGLRDDLDNCILVPNGPLAGTGPPQHDTDGDAFGNACDADLNDDGIVNFLDLALFKAVFLSGDADADLTGDGIVNFLDLARLKELFLKPPGPSGTTS